MASVQVEGLRIAYERAGDGPPLVLLHGYVADGATTWRHQIAGLADEFSVIAWDVPGAGRSSDPPAGFDMADYADCLTGFLDRLGLDRADVAGLSCGGALAIELGRRHPSRLRTLILVSAYAGWFGSLPLEVARQRLAQAEALAYLSADEFVEALIPTMFSEGTPDETVEEFAVALRMFHPEGFRTMARACAEDLRAALPSIDVPTLLIYGDRDMRAPVAAAEHLHDAVAGSTLVFLPGAGHVCNIEASEAFNQTVRAFLRGAGGSS